MNKKVKSFRYIKENLKHVFLIITIREINWLTYRVNDYELNPDSENTIFLINLLNTIPSYRILIKNCKNFPLILQQIFTTCSPQNTRVTTRFRSRSPKHLYGIFQFLPTFSLDTSLHPLHRGIKTGPYSIYSYTLLLPPLLFDTKINSKTWKLFIDRKIIDRSINFHPIATVIFWPIAFSRT